MSDDNARPRARRRMALGLFAALCLAALVVGAAVAVILDATMDVVTDQWP